MSEEGKEITLVYLGIRTITNKNEHLEKTYAYSEADKIEAFLSKNTEVRLFKKQLAPCSIGSQLKCQAIVDGERVIIQGKPVWSGRIENRDLIIKLEVKSAAAAANFELDRIASSEQNFSELEHILIPVRDAYRHLHPNLKRMFIGWLIKFLTD